MPLWKRLLDEIDEWDEDWPEPDTSREDGCSRSE